MALAAATIWEVRSATGSDTNGGGFVEGASGTDYSQQAAKNTVGSDISTTDAVANGTTTITSATANFSTGIVGNIVYFSGGTGSITGTWRQVTARASATSITIDLLIAASTGMTMNIGGALATTQAVLGGGQMVAGMSIYATGSESRATGLTAFPTNIRYTGYTTTRLDGGKYTITASAGLATLLTNTATSIIENLILDGNGQTITSTFLLQTGGSALLRNIEIKGVAGTNLITDIRGAARQIYIHDNTSSGSIFAPANSLSMEEVEISNNSSVVAVLNLATNAIFVSLKKFLIYNNGGDAIKTGSFSCSVQLSDGVIYGAGGNGINQASAGAASLPGIEAERVLIVNSVSKAIAQTTTTQKFKVRIKNVYQFNSGSASTNTFEGTLTALSGDPFVNAASGNFALSPTGADYNTLKAIGFTYPRGTTVDYGAAGAAQPQAAGGLPMIGSPLINVRSVA